MKKKLVSLVLVLSLVLGSMSLGFAAGDLTAGIEDNKVVKAVERLSAFGIVNGMDDGKYHPEMDVTREQFAKVLVEALGLGTAATAAQGSTKFGDVEASRWSAGYINVAVGQGILKGYPDGTFGPAKNVTYAEAVTMLVRALGYQDSFLPGTWPGNYVAKAAEEGITSGVVYAPTGFADRGSMAVMVNNTLDADVVKVQEYGTLSGTEIKYVKSDNDLLQEKLGICKLEEAVVVGTPKVDNGIDKDQVKLEVGKDFEYKSLKVEEEDVVTYDVTDKVDTTNLLGLSLNAYVTEDDKDVVYVEESAKPFKVLYDVVDPDEDIDEDGTTLIKADKEYKFEMDGNDADYTIFLDNEEVNFNAFKAEAEDGDLFVKAVLSNKGNIKVIDAHRFDKEGVAKSADSAMFKYFVNDADDDKTFKVKDFDKVVVMDNTGKSMKLEDIKANDVVYVNEKDMDGNDLEEASSKDEVAYVFVVRDVVSGEVDRYDQDDFEVKIAGKAYDVDANATVSSNTDKDIYLFNDTKAEKALDDITADNAKALAILDAKGYVRHLTTDAKASSNDLFGVITATDTEFGDVEVKLLNNEEAVVKYELDVDDEDFMGGYASEADIEEGDVVKYTLDKSGKIDSIQLVTSYNDATGVYSIGDEDDDYTPVNGTLTDDFTKDSMEVDGKDYVVSSGVVVFDYVKGLKADEKTIDDLEDIESIKFSSLNDKGDGKKVVFFTDKNDEVDLIVLVDKVKSSDERAAYVLKKWTKDGDTYIEMVEYGKEGKVDIEVDGNKKIVEEESIIVFTENNDGTIDVVDLDEGVSPEEDFTLYTGMVSDVSGRFITVNEVGVDGKVYAEGNKIETVRAESSVVVYETDDENDFTDVDEKDLVTLAVKDGKIQAVKIYDIDVTDEIDSDDSEVEAFVAAYEAHNGSEPGQAEDTDVEKAIAKIDAIPAVANLKLSDKATVVAARAAYDALTASEKKDVPASKLNALEAAEERIAELEDVPVEGDIEASFRDAGLGFTVTVTSDIDGATHYVVYKGTKRVSEVTELGKEAALSPVSVKEGNEVTIKVLSSNNIANELGSEDFTVK